MPLLGLHYFMSRRGVDHDCAEQVSPNALNVSPYPGWLNNGGAAPS